MYPFVFREADGFPGQTLYMSSEIQVFSFYLPSIVFPDPMHTCRNIFRIRTPIIGMINRDGKWLKQSPKYQKIFIFSFSVMPSQYASAFSFYGVPSPTLIRFILDKTPKFIHLSFKANLNFQFFHFAAFFFVRKIWISFWWSFFLTRTLPCLCLSATPCRYLEHHYCLTSSRLSLPLLPFYRHCSGTLNENSAYILYKTNVVYLRDSCRFSANLFRHNANSELFDNEPYSDFCHKDNKNQIIYDTTHSLQSYNFIWLFPNIS